MTELGGRGGREEGEGGEVGGREREMGRVVQWFGCWTPES